jgi:hypothetical protein
MTKYSQGTFKPQNPQKLLGNAAPTYRSSWENHCMHWLDLDPRVIQWGSECVRIPYRNPLTGRATVYVPDFLIMYETAQGGKRVELVEVKPKKEALMEAAKSRRDKAFVILNSAKWSAAQVWCAKHGIHFRVITEEQIFVNRGKR